MRLRRIITLLVIVLVLAACGQGIGIDGHRPPADSDFAGSGELLLTLDVAQDWLQAVDLSNAVAPSYEVHVITLKQATRRIDPGDIPDGYWLGQAELLGANQWRISGLPLEQNLLLQVLLSPSIDPVTRQPLPATSEYRLATHFPIRLSSDSSPQFSAAIALDDDPQRGYYVESQIQRADIAGQQRVTRTYLEEAVVACDNDHDGDFADESQLPDPSRIGVSQQLLTKLDSQNTAVPPSAAFYTAELASVTPASGELYVSELRQVGTGAAPESPPEVIRFAEDAGFIQRVVRIESELAGSLAPQLWEPGTSATLLLTAVDTANPGEMVYWLESANNLKLELPKDSIAAVPLKQTARPGEPVPVTIYVNQTSYPLHAVKNLRVSFDQENRYLTGSLDPGDRGGGAEWVDGVWSELGETGFILPDADKIATTTIDDERAYIDLAIAPTAAGELETASGAVCNFQMICHTTAKLKVERIGDAGAATFYTNSQGQPAQWSVFTSAPSPQVSVGGMPIVLHMLNPPAGSASSWDNPYIVAAGTEHWFSLSDPAMGDVTLSELTHFLCQNKDLEYLPTTGDRLLIPEDYYGPLIIEASYNGIFSSLDSAVYLFVDQEDGFELNIHESESYVFGASVQRWSLEFQPERTSLHVRVTAHSASGLRACYFSMAYDPELYVPQEYVTSDYFNSGMGALTLPHSFLRYGTDSLTTGMCLVRPQEQPGFNGDGMVMDIIFQRLGVGAHINAYSTPIPQPALPEFPCAEAEYVADSGSLNWYSVLAGDFNQDGVVCYTTGDSAPYGDLTQLAVNFGVQDFSAESIGAAIDSRWDPARELFDGDGEISIADIFPILAYMNNSVDSWHVLYSADVAGYPAGGTEVYSTPFSSYRGDPLSERISYTWQPEEGLPAGTYWIVPALDGSTGQASPPVTIEASYE